MNTLHILKRLSTVTLFLLFAAGCSAPPPTPVIMPIPTSAADFPTAAPDTPAPTAPTIDRTVEQYAIYSAVLASGAPNYNLGNQVVILNETNTIDPAQLPTDLSSLSPTLVADYQTANVTPQPLEGNFNLTLPYAFINETERQQYVNDWPAFFAAYPDAEGYLTDIPQ